MKMFVALTTLLCLVPLALSEDNQCKDVAGVDNFNFDSFSNNFYGIGYYSAVPAFNKGFLYGFQEIFEDDDNTTYSIIFFNQTDSPDWQILSYRVDKVDGATIYLTKVVYNADSDEPTVSDENVIAKVVGYKENVYTLLYYCGKGVGPEYRMALIANDQELDVDTRKEILANDDKLGFKNTLVEAI